MSVRSYSHELNYIKNCQSFDSFQISIATGVYVYIIKKKAFYLSIKSKKFITSLNFFVIFLFLETMQL